MPRPTWGPDLSALDSSNIYYYIKPLDSQKRDWNDVPDTIKDTFVKLGIPQAEQNLLAGVGAQYESEVIYKSLKQKWVDQGVIFCDMNTGLAEHPELFKKLFCNAYTRPMIIPLQHLIHAVWSGGSFVYVPKGVHIDLPLQAYFRINADRMGQFERTLIIAEEGSSVHYIEGCSAPVYSHASLHSAVVEIFAHEGAQVQYTTIQNWAPQVYNLVTKRAMAYRNASSILG